MNIVQRVRCGVHASLLYVYLNKNIVELFFETLFLELLDPTPSTLDKLILFFIQAFHQKY